MKKTIKSPKKSKMTKMTRQSSKPRKTRKTMKLTSQQPLVLYSKNNITGEETVAAFTKKNNNTMHGYAMAVQSQIPPTIHKSSNGSSVMTMSQKRSLVVEDYKNLSMNRVKLPRVVRSKVQY
jgi:hypothetical protein